MKNVKQFFYFIMALNLSNLNLKSADVNKLLTLSNIKYFDFTNNNIKEVNLRVSRSIEILNLSHNKIEKLIESAGEVWANVTILDLSHNLISSIPELRYPSLKVLSLRFNKIVNSPSFIYLKEMQSLDLSHNVLKRFRNYSLPSLSILNLSNNDISHFNEKQNLPQLKELCLENNPIITAIDTNNRSVHSINERIKQVITSSPRRLSDLWTSFSS